MSHHVLFMLDGQEVDVEVEENESLLSVLRERLGVTSVKDGCAPQGQCGCCTVLVDGEARVSCVTPVDRIIGREVTTVEGLDPVWRDACAASFVATGGSQCGFCTPGIIVRCASALGKGRDDRASLGRALAAHVCRCTGWQSVLDALESPAVALDPSRDLGLASERAALEGGVPQQVGASVPLGGANFADDLAPRDALVAVPRSPGVEVSAELAEGIAWVVADTLREARIIAGKVQGRRTTLNDSPPLDSLDSPINGVALATSWVDAGYLEPDASWCEPGGEPATVRGNGGGFGGKADSLAPPAARILADRLQRSVRVVMSREDVVQFSAKRAPISATAHFDSNVVKIRGTCASGGESRLIEAAEIASPYGVGIDAAWESVPLPVFRVSSALRSFGLAETAVLVEGALTAAGADRLSLIRDERSASVLLDTCVMGFEGALAGARVTINAGTGRLEKVEVRVAAGDPLDDVVLSSYASGAAHMALGWVLTEGLAVDPETGEPLDLTIRSLGVIRAKDIPEIEVIIVDEAGPPLARSSDAVFAAVAGAAWDALLRSEGSRPSTFPARETRTARILRR